MNRAHRRAQAKATRKRSNTPQSSQQAITGKEAEVLTIADALHRAGGFPECKSVCEQLLRQNPRQKYALHLLGLSHAALGEKTQAEAAFRAMLNVHPDFVDGCFNFANFLRQEKRFAEAAQFYQKVITSDPAYCNAYINLGRMLMLEEKKYLEALSCFRHAVMLRPEEDNHWTNYHAALIQLRTLKPDDVIMPNLLGRLSRTSKLTIILIDIGLRFIAADPAADQLLARRDKNHAEFAAALRREEPEPILSSPLLLTLLERYVVLSCELEQMLTAIRWCLLEWTVTDAISENSIAAWMTFLQALSHQCFRNEYVYYFSEEEQPLLDILRNRLERMTLQDKPGLLQRWEVLVYSCYAPLYRLSNSKALATAADMAGNKAYSNLLRSQILNPLEELSISKDIPAFGAITHTVSKAVQDQYESNPYPRWEEMAIPVAKSLAEIMRETFPMLGAEVFAGLPENPDILVAGCGTGRHALQAAYSYKDSRVLAVDLSRASLAYAIRKARETRCDRVEFMQADILSLSALDRQFDIIECVGVLHHMQDPLEGWKILVSCLRPKGMMKIALYSEVGRAHIVEARTRITRNHYPATPEGIRRCRLDIMRDTEMPERQRLLKSMDFFVLSECRDLIFHVQEHRFTLPQIGSIIHELGLEFLRFTNVPEMTLEHYRQMFPQDKEKISLENVHIYEQQNPSTFASMYHFWVRKR